MSWKWYDTAGIIGSVLSGSPIPALLSHGLGSAAKNWWNNDGKTLLGGQLDINTDKGQEYWNNLSKYINEERAWNSAEAQKNRNWQERMANTAVQRSVADIQAAGLNPWLAVQGSSALSGGSYSGAQAESSGASSAAASMMNANMNNQVKLITSLVQSLTSLGSSALKVLGQVASTAAK